MMHHVEMQYFFHRFLNILNSRIAELDYFMAIGANQVIVLLETIRFFILRQVLAELMFTHQIALNQQVQGIVHRCPAYPVIVVLHTDVE